MSGGRPIRLALIGGGPGSFIGGVHRRAAALDGRFALVAGMFSRDADRSRAQGTAYGLAPERVHADLASLIAAEAARDDGIEAVAVTTPNDSHFAISRDALAAGLHVICDKPMTATLGEARALGPLVAQAPGRYALTYTYTGYALIREARDRIAAGEIGRVRKIVVDYPQGWLAAPVEAGNRQASWRTDPARAGAGGCIGDIGVHAFQLAEHVSGLRVESLCADLPRVVPGRRLDDDCNILLRFGGGVPGVLIASQIATGERNGLRLRVYGECGAIDWCHDAPGELRLLRTDRMEILFAGSAALGHAAAAATRLPAGHSEGFIEAFATLYRDFADAIEGEDGVIGDRLPGFADGLRSMAFIDTAVRSDAARAWLALDGDGR